MPTTYGPRLPLLLLFILSLAQGQSLEDKVFQSRRLESQSQSEMDQRSFDSLTMERNTIEARRGKAAPEGKQRRLSLDRQLEYQDSLIAGPRPFEEEQDDTIDFRDSTEAGDKSRIRRRRAAKDSLKRYEQRIFRSANPSAFSGASGKVGRDYVLGSGDEVFVFLWGDKEKEYNLALNGEGKIFLEGVGLVPLAGLTLDGAATRLKERLARIYSGIGRGTTHVDVSMGRPGPIKVFLLGEVKTPGGYVFSGNTSVLSALYFARGPNDIGSVRNLQLTRGGKKYSLDLYQYLMKGENLAPGSLLDGDILFAPRADILVEIRGDVGRPAIYELKKGEGVKEMLEFGGRPNATAAIQRMTVQRILPGGKVEYKDLEAPQRYLEGQAKMDLQDGDRILVHRSTESSENFMTITGPVKYPGTYSAEGATTVKDLVAKAGGLREDAFLGRAHILRFRSDGSSILLSYSLDTAYVDTISIGPKDNVVLYSLREMYVPDTVEVAGAVFNPGRYEFREGMTAKDLVMQAGGFLPNHEQGKLLVFRGDVREDKVEQITLKVGPGLAKTRDSYLLKPRDFVQVPEDARWYKKEIVTLSGLFTRPGKYALLYRGERLSSVVERAGGFKANAYNEGGRFFRTKDSVGRMGVDILKALSSPRSKANIGMVGGDSIYIPERAHSVKVIGEVGFETSVLFKDGAAAMYYVEKAGGFTRRSEKDRIVVQYANGETSRDGYFNRKPDAGSVIYVPQGPEPKPIDWFSGINALLGTVGVVVALILSIQAISQ